MSGWRARLEGALNRVWYPPTRGARPSWAGRILLALLTPLEWAFRSAVAGRRFAYRKAWVSSHEAAVPVVVVGNLSVGGTGKTPFTLYLAKCLGEDAGLSVGIVTRGYGGAQSARRSPLRVEATSDAAQVGDEAVLLATHHTGPVAAGRDRVAAARLLASEVDVLLADDGLQHLRLARALEIVLLDEQRGLGNGRLLPCGPLREPRKRLQEADLLVLTGARGAGEEGAVVQDNASGLAARLPTLRAYAQAGSVFAVASPARTQPLSAFAGMRVHAVAGIADPGRFFRLLRASGLEVIEHPLADHAQLDGQTLAFADELPVLMTEKDAVKCREFADARCWAVRLEVHMDAAARRSLVELVLALCREGAPNGS